MKYLSLVLVFMLAACSRDDAEPTTPPAQQAKSTGQIQQNSPVEPIAAELIVDFASASAQDLAQITGMSDPETWGRWSVDEAVRMQFYQPLPRQFTLEVVARAFGPNVEAPITVSAGGQTQTFAASASDQTYRLSFSLAEPTDTIEFRGMNPTSPASMGISEDARTLGLGIIMLKVSPSATPQN